MLLKSGDLGERACAERTLLWTALIVVGAVMIAVAVWPSIHGSGRPAPPADRPRDDPDGPDRSDEA